MVLSPFSMFALLLLCLLGVPLSLQHCPVWKEIVPCTCKMDKSDALIKLMSIYCDKMESFDHVLKKLGGHFQPTDRVSLKLSFSSLSDLYKHSFNELNMTIEDLKLNHDVIGLATIRGLPHYYVDSLRQGKREDCALESIYVTHLPPN